LSVVHTIHIRQVRYQASQKLSSLQL